MSKTFVCISSLTQLMIFSFSISLSVAQPYTRFQKSFYVDTINGRNSFGDISIGSDSMFYAIGGYYKPGGGEAYIQKVYTDGNQIWLKAIRDSITNDPVGNKEIIGISNNRILLFRYVEDTTLSYLWGNLGFGKINYTMIDTSGDFLWSKTFDDSIPYPSSSDYCLVETKDYGLVSVFSFNTYELDTTFGVLLTKLDTSGSLLFRNKYYLNFDLIKDTLFEARKVCELQDGSLVLCGLTWNFVDAVINGILLKVDSIGNVLFCKIFEPSVGEFVDLKQTEVNKFIALSHPIDTTTFNFQARVIELDSTFNIVKGATVGIPGSNVNLYKIFYKNGQLFFSGFPNVLKIDTGLSLVLKAYNYAFGGTTTDSKKNLLPDGGIAFARAYVNYNFSTITKTDSTFDAGCYTYDILPFLTISPFLSSIANTIPVLVENSVTSSKSVSYISTSQSPTVDSIYCSTTGLMDENDDENDLFIEVFPNPAENWLSINLKKVTRYQYSFFNISGIELLSGVIDNFTTQIDLSLLPCGLYVISLKDGQSNQCYKKIVKPSYTKFN